jgi:hypothetical protein
MLSTAQLLTRYAQISVEVPEDADVKMAEEQNRRTSVGDSGDLKELVGDLTTLLGDEETGSEGVMGWLRKVVWNTFEQTE